MKKGGVFAGDDYYNGFVMQAGYSFGVRDAVDEFFTRERNYRVQASGAAFPDRGVFQQVSFCDFLMKDNNAAVCALVASGWGPADLFYATATLSSFVQLHPRRVEFPPPHLCYVELEQHAFGATSST